jgi:RNA polymerase sigma-70 factor (ECF subfamily)
MVQSHVETVRESPEAELIRRAVGQDESAIRAIIQANNRRLYRVARSIVRDDSAAEDVLQESYLRAFSALAEFRGGSTLATWLTRIVLNQALQHLRRRSEIPHSAIDPPQGQGEVIPFPLSGNPTVDPERAMAQRELCQLLERAIDELPEDFRTVLIARVIEEMSIEETAELLGLRPETVKTRLHRARRLLKTALAEHMDSLFSDVFPFQGKRCERLTSAVIKQLMPGSR